MGTIIPRGDSFRAIIRKKGHKTLTRTFEKRSLAKAWIVETELALSKKLLPTAGVSIGKLITRYLEEIGPVKPLTKDSIKAFKAIAKTADELYLTDLTAQGLLAWKAKYHSKAAPQSFKRYMSRVTTVLTTAEAIWGIVVPWAELKRATFYLKTIGAVSAGTDRIRRISQDELTLISKNLNTSLPVVDIIDFALVTCLRSNEICSVRRSDINREKRTILVRDRKHPTKKLGNNTEIPLLGNAIEIIDRQPIVKLEDGTDEDRIFPFLSDSVESAFHRAVVAAGIVDLTFHDTRHEAISRLFEAGYQIQEVAIVSGHRSWNSLKIYTNLRPESLHR